MARSRTLNLLGILFWAAWIGLAGHEGAWGAADDAIPGISLPSSPIAGSLNESTDVDDVYAIKLQAGQKLIVSITGPTNSQFDLYLYPPGSTSFDDDFIAYAELASYPNRLSYVVPGTGAGTYYLDAYCEYGTGNYVIAYTIQSASADDQIPGSAIGSSPITGTLSETSDVDDVRKISLTAGQVLYASISGATNTEFDVFLFGPDATDVNWDQTVAVDFHDTYPFLLRYTVPAGKAGNYYLDAYCVRGTGSYTLTYKIVTGGTDDVFPGATLGPTPVSGSLNIDSDYQDIYAVNLAAGQKISITLIGDAGTDYDLLLFPPGTIDSAAGGQVARSFKTSYPETLSYTVPAGKGGKYYVAARSYNGSGGYKIYYNVISTKNSAHRWAFYE